MENGQTAGRCFKKSEMVNDFFINEAIMDIIYIFEKAMNSGYSNLCHMLIFVKSKKAFELFELFKILTHSNIT